MDERIFVEKGYLLRRFAFARFLFGAARRLVAFLRFAGLRAFFARRVFFFAGM
jgi:hypothetical protein